MHKAFKQIIILDYQAPLLSKEVKDEIIDLFADDGGRSNGCMFSYYPLENLENGNSHPNLNDFCIQNGFGEEIYIWVCW